MPILCPACFCPRAGLGDYQSVGGLCGSKGEPPESTEEVPRLLLDTLFPKPEPKGLGLPSNLKKKRTRLARLGLASDLVFTRLWTRVAPART